MANKQSIEATQRYFPVVQLIFMPVDEILTCDLSNETYWTILFSVPICLWYKEALSLIHFCWWNPVWWWFLRLIVPFISRLFREFSRPQVKISWRLAQTQRRYAVLTIKSGLLTSFSNILFTLLRMSNMAVSRASGDPFRRGRASVMYLKTPKFSFRMKKIKFTT